MRSLTTENYHSRTLTAPSRLRSHLLKGFSRARSSDRRRVRNYGDPSGVCHVCGPSITAFGLLGPTSTPPLFFFFFSLFFSFFFFPLAVRTYIPGVHCRNNVVRPPNAGSRSDQEVLHPSTRFQENPFAETSPQTKLHAPSDFRLCEAGRSFRVIHTNTRELACLLHETVSCSSRSSGGRRDKILVKMARSRSLVVLYDGRRLQILLSIETSVAVPLSRVAASRRTERAGSCYVLHSEGLETASVYILVPSARVGSTTRAENGNNRSSSAGLVQSIMQQESSPPPPLSSNASRETLVSFLRQYTRTHYSPSPSLFL